VVEPGGRSDLAEETLGVEHLERDQTVVLEVAGEVDHGHAPAAEFTLELAAGAKRLSEGWLDGGHEYHRRWEDRLECAGLSRSTPGAGGAARQQNAQGVKPWAFSLPASSVPCDLFLRDADLLSDPLGHRQILLQGRELLLDQVPYLR
jgi:hypothetical protein